MKNLWTTFSTAPHRMYFFFGGVSFILSMSWWLLYITSISYAPYLFGKSFPQYAIVPFQLHGILMVFGLFTFFILGFLTTTFPRWMNRPPISKKIYAPSSIGLFGGYLLLLFGSTHLELWLFGGALFALGWIIGIAGLFDVLRQTSNRINHGWICLIGNLAGWLLFVFTLIAVMPSPWLPINPNILLHAAIWWFLLPVFSAVCHRMLPFFTKAMVPEYPLYRPDWALYAIALLASLHPVLSQVHLAFIDDLLMLGVTLHLSFKWKPSHFPKNPLLTSLHISFLWLSIALGLFLIQDISYSLNAFGFSPSIWQGQAPLHAMTIGFFTSMFIAMVTRVTQGHSGGMLIMSKITWGLFWGIQGVALLRVSSEVPDINTLRTPLLIASALGWILFSLAWFLQYGPKYLKPRSDGNPG